MCLKLCFTPCPGRVQCNRTNSKECILHSFIGYKYVRSHTPMSIHQSAPLCSHVHSTWCTTSMVSHMHHPRCTLCELLTNNLIIPLYSHPPLQWTNKVIFIQGLLFSFQNSPTRYLSFVFSRKHCQNSSHNSSMWLSLPQSSRIFGNSMELSRFLHFYNLLEISRTFKTILESSPTFQNSLEHSRTFQTYLEIYSLLWRILDLWRVRR